jgi:acyl-CoA hydrolase
MMVTVLFGGLLMAVVSGAAWAYAADPVSEGEPVTITVDEVKDLDGSGIEHG